MSDMEKFKLDFEKSIIEYNNQFKKTKSMARHARWNSPMLHARARLVGMAYRGFAIHREEADRFSWFMSFAKAACWSAERCGAKDMDSDNEASFYDFPILKAWNGLGMPTFELTESLCANLMMSDPSHVAFDDIAWPFDAFRLVLPSTIGQEMIVPGDPVRDTRLTDAIIGVRMPRWSKDSYNRVHAKMGKESTLNQILTALCEEEAVCPPERNALIALIHRASGDKEILNDPLEINTIGELLSKIDGWEDEYYEDHKHGQEQKFKLGDRGVNHYKAIIRLAVNLCLYLSSHDEETGKTVWSPNDKTEGGGGLAKRWVIGRTVKVGPEVRQAARDIAAGRPPNAQAVRHIVRGHFAMQPHGPQSSLRKRIYRKPYWRNAEKPDGGPRVYKVT